MMKFMLILSLMIIFFASESCGRKIPTNFKISCFTEKIKSYIEKLKNKIYVQSQKINSFKIYQLKPLYDYALTLYRIKIMEKTNTTKLNHELELLKNLTYTDSLKFLTKNIIENIQNNTEIKIENINLINSLKFEFLSYKISYWESKIIAEILAYNFQLIYFENLNYNENDCLPADFEYLINLNEFRCEYDSEEGKKSNNNSNDIDQEYQYIDVKNKNYNMKDINNFDDVFYSNDFVPKVKTIYSNVIDYSVINEMDTINQKIVITEPVIAIDTVFSRKIDPKKNFSGKKLKSNFNKRLKYSFKHKQTCNKMIDMIVNDIDYDYFLGEMINSNEKLSFYFILKEVLENFNSTKTINIFDSNNHKIFYSITKQEIDENVKFIHMIQIYDQNITFSQLSKCDQNSHIFFTIDNTYEKEIIFVFSVRFTHSTDFNFSKSFNVNREIIINNYKNQLFDMNIKFDSNLVKSINIFKDFSYTFFEEISIIYKLNKFLNFYNYKNINNIKIFNFLGNDAINYNEQIFDYEDEAFNYLKILTKNSNDLNKISSKFIDLTQCKLSNNNIKALKEFSNLEKSLKNCIYVNENFSCLKCKKSFKLINNECLDEDSDGYDIVEKCNIDNCKTCLNRNNCRICKEKYLLQNGQCVTECSTGTFKDDSTEFTKCLNCSENCFACKSNEECITCIDKDNFFLKDGKCTPIIPIEKIENIENNEKSKDDDGRKIDCSKCEKIENIVDGICKDGKNLLFNKCYLECPEGFYPKDNKCRECSSNCKKCTENIKNNGTTCSICNDTFNLVQGVCLNKCGKEKYENKEKGYCERCYDENCSYCSNALMCTKCNKDSFLYKKAEEVICLNQCPKGFFNDRITNTCKKCKENCKICSDEDDCIACQDNFYLMENKSCVENCPLGFGVSEGKCKRCMDSNCEKCHTNDLSKCIKCSDGKYINEDRCINADECYLIRKYPDHIQKKCRKCDSKCNRCKDANTCLECLPEFGPNLKSNRKNFYNRKLSLLKEKSTKDSNNTLSENTVSCINPCPENKQIDLETNSCMCCKDPFCKECSEKGEKCLKCDIKTSLFDSSCYKICPTSHFKDFEYGKCRKCSIGCEECRDKRSCSRCLPGYFKLENGNCSKFCPDGYYKDYHSRQCEKCDKSCEVCKKDDKNCEVCSFSYFKFNNQCVNRTQCKVGTFPNYDLRECVKCEMNNCVDCINNKICRVCKEGYKVSRETSQCVFDRDYIRLINNPVMFSNFTNGYNQSLSNQTFDGDFRISCKNTKSISLSFWQRVITNNITNSSILFEITHPFYRDYILSEKDLKFDPYEYSDPGFYLNFKIVENEPRQSKNLFNNHFEENPKNESEYNNGNLTDKNNNSDDIAETLINIEYNFTNTKYNCSSEIWYITNDLNVKRNSLDSSLCNFIMIKEWTMFLLSLKFIDDNKVNFNFTIYDSVIKHPYNYEFTFSDKIYYSDELNMITKDSSIIYNDKKEINPIFELSDFRVFEKILSESEISNLFLEIPDSCDVNCANCIHNKCMKCRDNKSYKDGYCSPTYISLNNYLLELNRPKILSLNELNKEISYNYFASDRFSFVTNFYLEKNKNFFQIEPILLFKMFYSSKISLFEVYLHDLGKIKVILNSKITFFFDIKIFPELWHGINISMSGEKIKIWLKNEMNEYLINEKYTLQVDEFIIRLIPFAQVYFYGGELNNLKDADIILYDSRVYFNNNFNDLNDFSCGDFCNKCNKKRECISCIAGYKLLQNPRKKCTIIEDLNPFYTAGRKSLYDHEEFMLNIPKTDFNSRTISIWMKKNLANLPGSSSKILSLVDLKTNRVFPILTQETSLDRVTTYKIDSSNIQSREENLNKNDPYNLANIQPNPKRVQILEKFKRNNSTITREFYEEYQKEFNFSLNYRNKTFNYFHLGTHVKINPEKGNKILTLSLIDPLYDINFKTKFLVDKKKLDNFELILGDGSKSNINMAIGPIKVYKGNILRESIIYKMIQKTIPKECDPSCKQCDYNTGKCLLCGKDSINSKKCTPFFFGFFKSINSKKTISLETKKKSNSTESKILMNRKSIQKDSDFSTSLSEFFDLDVNSNTYAVFGWFYLVEFPSSGKENIIFRLSNSDIGNFINQDNQKQKFDPGLNLITLFLKNSEKNDKEFVFIVSDGVEDKHIISQFKPELQKWIFAYALKNSTGLFFEYSLTNSPNLSVSRVNLNYISEPLQEITSLKLFGINSVQNKNLEFAVAVAYNFYMIPHLPESNNIVNDFLKKIDPTKPNVFDKCEHSCKTCILDMCIECLPEFYVLNHRCVKKMDKYNVQMLLNQDNINKDNYDLDIDANIVKKGSYSVQFYIRRNRHPLTIIYDNDQKINKNYLAEKSEKNREIVTFGNLKIWYLNTMNNGKLRLVIDSPSFDEIKRNATNEYIVYNSDDNSDFEWYFVNIFIDKVNIYMRVSELFKINERQILKFNHNGILKNEFQKIHIDNLNGEFTLYGFILVEANQFIENNLLQIPKIDCPIDCSFCDIHPNNVCLKCDYGEQCTLNDSKNRLCRFRFIKLNSVYISQKNNTERNNEAFDEDSPNFFKLSDIYADFSNKIIRFKSFTLTFTVSIDLSKSYDSIVKIINYDREKETIEKASEYPFLDLQFDSSEKIFTITYSNKNIIRTTLVDEISYKLSSYKNKNNLNQYHYIAITYNDKMKLFNIVILNSKDNYIVENFSINGNLDFLGKYSYIIFGDNFREMNSYDNLNNCEMKFFDIKFMHENSLNTIELINILQKNFENNYLHGCKFINLADKKCNICDEGLNNVNGICHIINKDLIQVKIPFTDLINYDSIPQEILLEYKKPGVINSFSVQFLYTQREENQSLTGILKLTKYDSSNKSVIRDILEILQKDQTFLIILRPFSDTNIFFSFFLDEIFKNIQNYSWVFVTINVNLSLKVVFVHIYDYKTSEIKSKKYEYLKIYNNKESNKNFNVMELKDNEKFAFSFDFLNEYLTITSETQNLIFNQNASGSLKYKLSTLIFFVNQDLETNDITKVVPYTPKNCICLCECINDICPIKCRLENLWINYKSEDYHKKGFLYDSFSEILEKNALNLEFFKNDDTLLPELKAQLLNNQYKKASISFRIDIKKYVNITNQFYSQIFSIPSVKEYLRKFFNIDQLEEELLKTNVDNLYNFLENQKTMQILIFIEKAFESKNFITIIKDYFAQNGKITLENGVNGMNLNYLFSLTDIGDSLELSNDERITNENLKNCILTLKRNEDKFTIYVGKNKVSDGIFKRDLDIQYENSLNENKHTNLMKIESINFYMNIDIENNMLNVVLFINDMRKDFEIKYSHQTDYLGYFSGIYLNPSVDDLVVNVGEISIAQHLNFIKKKIEDIKFKQKFCDDCEACFVGDKKFLKKCLVCPNGKFLYNNNCLEIKNKRSDRKRSEFRRKINEYNISLKNILRKNYRRITNKSILYRKKS